MCKVQSGGETRDSEKQQYKQQLQYIMRGRKKQEAYSSYIEQPMLPKSTVHPIRKVTKGINDDECI